MILGLRWFVGLDWEGVVFDPTTLSKNRERLFGEGGAEALLGHIARQAEIKGLLHSDRLIVDRALIKAWTSHMSFQPKPKEDENPAKGPGSALGKFWGIKGSNKTHESTTGPDAKLLREGPGMEAILCFPGSVILDPLSGLLNAGLLRPACDHGENSEVKAALELAEEYMEPAQILVSDSGYDTRKFKDSLRD